MRQLQCPIWYGDYQFEVTNEIEGAKALRKYTESADFFLNRQYFRVKRYYNASWRKPDRTGRKETLSSVPA
jgi:hypothetical protein